MKMYSNTASFLSGLVDLEMCQFDLNLYLETSDSEIESSEEQLHTSDSYLERHLQLRRSLRLVKPVRNLYITYRDAIISNQCEGVVLVASMGDKGRGIVTTQSFCQGDFILEYKGDVINKKEAARREEHYKRIPEMGCFMFYFVHDGKRLCIDGTKDTGNLGRLVNANAEYREWVVHLASQKAKSEERQKWRSLGQGKGEVESAVASIGVTEETEEDKDLSSSIPDDGEFLKFQ